MKTNLRERLTM